MKIGGAVTCYDKSGLGMPELIDWRSIDGQLFFRFNSTLTVLLPTALPRLFWHDLQSFRPGRRLMCSEYDKIATRQQIVLKRIDEIDERSNNINTMILFFHDRVHRVRVTELRVAGKKAIRMRGLTLSVW